MNNCSCSLGSARAWACFFFFNSASICTRARAVRARVPMDVTGVQKNGQKLRATKVISTPLGPLQHLISNFNHPGPDKQSPDVTSQRAFNQPPHFGL